MRIICKKVFIFFCLFSTNSLYSLTEQNIRDIEQFTHHLPFSDKELKLKIRQDLIEHQTLDASIFDDEYDDNKKNRVKKYITKNLAHLPFLKRLILYGIHSWDNFRFTAIPPEIFNMKDLIQLELPCHDIEEIPEDIIKLENLEILDLGFNSLSDLPKNFKHLTKLKKINLCLNGRLDNETHNFIEKLIPLTQLETLDLSYGGITKFPEDLCELHSLKSLSIDVLAGETLQLPATITHLKNLESFSTNNLKEFPLILLECIQLKKLELTKCTYRSLPDNFDRLINLEEIDFTNNYFLKSLPSGIAKLQNLKKITLKNCAIADSGTENNWGRHELLQHFGDKIIF